MEKVIFHGIAIIILIYLLSMSAFNLMYEQYFLGSLLFIMCFVLIIFYYKSRFRGRYKTSYLLFGMICYPIIGLNFYLNDGMDGPSAYVFLMFHIIMMVLSSRKQYLLWILYNAFFVSIALYMGMFHPELIPNVYLDTQHQFWDHLITYVVSLFGIYAIIGTLKRFYELQKRKNEKNSLELREVNHLLQNSNEQKNKVMALISHDIRSPLNSITGILEVVQAGDMDKKEMEQVWKELLTITANTTRMLDNILEWASYEMREEELNVTENDVRSACASILSVFTVLASHKDIQLVTIYRDNPIVKTDFGRMTLVVRNLLQNAIKFTPAGGEITFTVIQVEEQVKISVSDNGIGLNQEQLDSLFLLNIKSTYGTKMEKGTGLGLYLSLENAKKIGADISVESKEGEGSTFTITLPRLLETEPEELSGRQMVRR